ncbi:hypothetical protein VN0561_08680 [Helicobacter pylori]
MWGEKIIKIIPAVLLLFCLLETFELVLTIGFIGKIEKLEAEIRGNLKMLETIAILLNRHLEGMQLKYFEDKKIKIK